MEEMEENQQKALASQEKITVGINFENQCSDLHHKKCVCCHRVRINMLLNRKGMCGSCSKLKETNSYLAKKALPVWYKDEVPQFQVPEELQNLSLAEKMLIQRASPFVPLRFIKNGIFGISGHVCTFEQDVEEFVNRLPRHKDDVTMLNVLKTIDQEIGSDGDTRTQAFRVRKTKVGAALRWLKIYNVQYQDIEIEMSALDWLEGEEGTMQPQVIDGSESMETAHDACLKTSTDQGPNPDAQMAQTAGQNEVQDLGYHIQGGNIVLSERDQVIQDGVRDAINSASKKQGISVAWPSTSANAVHEYNYSNLFAKAYPWLFPGGIGDMSTYPGELSAWAEHLIYYFDGRFSKDKFFAFFALNYITRARNAKSGSWFMKNMNSGGPETLEDLQEQIRDGNTTFVNRLTYFAKCVKGSTPFWHQKRSELYNWIYHHVEVGNGAPTMFVTLSCGEYYWPDIIDLLRERMIIAGDDASECYVGSPQMHRILNDYCIVVQEYFQERVKIWLDTVGKEILGIKHYWVRYEFAPGRGQIHAHLLAIPKDHNIYKLCHNDLKFADGNEARAERLSKWAKDTMGMTAEVSDSFDDRTTDPKDSPSTIRLRDVNPYVASYEDDKEDLMKYCQEHKCSGFCLRHRNGVGSKRTCRCGCGKEKTKGQGDTPGFDLSDNPEIKTDEKHTKKLRMPRNHPRVNQTATDVLQSWRGNCDVQILIYDSDPESPDIREISRVTDYVVAYSCKGNTTLLEEKQHTKELIIAAEELTSGKGDIRRVCRQVLNQAAIQRVISKQEACVLLGNLHLVYCSEAMETISIASSKKLKIDKSEKGTNTLIQKYMKRDENTDGHLSLYEFFYAERERRGRSPAIPHFVGVSGTPTFPVTKGYAHHTLLVYKPWRKYLSGDDYREEFKEFIASRYCPKSARLQFDRVLQRFVTRTVFAEPKAHECAPSSDQHTPEDEELLALAGFNRSEENDDYDARLMKSLKRGLDFQWRKEPKSRNLTDDGDPAEWIGREVQAFEKSTSDTPYIPKWSDGKEYSIDGLYDDQKYILYKVVGKVKEFMEVEDLADFEPMRATINGQGGTGKTVLENTITSTLRKIFNRTDVCSVAAPTGTAACNVGGETCHKLTYSRPGGLAGEYKAFSMSRKQRELCVARFNYLLCSIIDERSMLASLLLGETGQKIAETIYGGDAMSKEDWGGLPVILLGGDDYQLPPAFGQGGFEARTRTDKHKMTRLGRETFKSCANNVFQLTRNKRMSSKEEEQKQLLERLRIGEDIRDSDVAKLQSLHLDEIERKHGASYVNEIKKKAVFLFWTNEKRIRHNLEMLVTTNTDDNPTAMIKMKSTGGKYGKGVNKHFENSTCNAALLCVGANVCIEGFNFCPLFGLHNGACGYVKEIVYEEGQSPNNGDFPNYTVVDFPLYSGPAWDADNPTHVPIPTVTIKCKHGCCTRQYVPLDLAFARTIHRFQGLTAGPVDEGKIENMYQCIVCDPDGKAGEVRNTGIFYTAVSRATTFGDPDGRNSAIYFIGDSLTYDRIKNLTKSDKGKELLNVTKRRNWVKSLDANAIELVVQADEAEDYKNVLEWAETARIPLDELHARIQKYKHDKRSKKRKFRHM